MRIDLTQMSLPNDVRLVLVIGLPGSGKSTIASEFSETNGFVHVEADQYFIDEDGVMSFSSELLEDAHEWCLSETKKLLDGGQNVIVSNTFITAEERTKYFALGYKFAVHTCYGKFQSIHNVDQDVIDRMFYEFEPYHEEEYKNSHLSTVPKVDQRKKWHVNVLWGSLPGGYKSPVFFDDKHNLLEDFTRYCFVKANENVRFRERILAHNKEVEAITQSLKAFAEFCSYKNIAWKEVHDPQLDDFREWELDRVLSSKNSKNTLSAKRTVNGKLQVVYNFICWAQEDAYLIENHIGMDLDAPVRSVLPQHIKGESVPTRNQRHKSFLYPKCFTRVGRGNTIEYTASDYDIENLRKFFRESSDFVYDRNLLLMDIGQHVGFRQGSMNSFTVDQFSEETFNKHDPKLGYILIQPHHQKLGYELQFKIPWALAKRIQRYIQLNRAELMKGKGIDESVALNRVFLRESNGVPLADYGVTDIFRKAFKIIGCQKGSGAHSLRRKYATDKIRLQIEIRKENKLSTDPESVCYPVSKDMGHGNKMSLQYYTDAGNSLLKDSVQITQQNRILELESKMADKDREIAILRKKTSKNDSQ